MLLFKTLDGRTHCTFSDPRFHEGAAGTNK
jgi:hypothetical protein